jgi:hypothetical protein
MDHEKMESLIKKYPKGYQGWEDEHSISEQGKEEDGTMDMHTLGSW